MERADDLEQTLTLNYGKLHSHDELGIALTQLYSFGCIVAALISIYKCSVITCAPTRQTYNIWLYPITILASLALALAANHNYSINFKEAPHIFLFAHPVLAIFRGFIFYKIMFAKPRAKVSSSKNLAEDVVKISVPVVEQSFAASVVQISSKVGFLAYWCLYALTATVFYTEVGKYITEEHIDMATIMKFVLV